MNRDAARSRNCPRISIQRFGVLSFLLLFIVALELPRALNRPRSGPP